MSTNKSPAFQFYPADYLADANVQMMSLEQEGIYIRLLCYCWREGSLPNDEEALARLVSKNCTLTDLRVVAKCFEPNGNRLVHVRLEAEREKQAEWRAKSAQGGLKSAEVRRERAKDVIRLAASQFKGGCEMVPTKRQPKVNSSTSSSSSSSSSFSSECDPDHARAREGHTRTHPRMEIPKPEPSEPKRDDEPLAEFCERSLFDPSTQAPWTLSNAFILVGRRPMKRYPSIWLTARELEHVFENLQAKVPATQWRDVFRLVEGRCTDAITQGKTPDRLSTYNWLMGWAVEDVLKQTNELTKIQRNSGGSHAAAYRS